MLRFFRGVDHTDILISNPCSYYAIFYASKLRSFDVKPIQNFIKSLITTFENSKVSFVSPALYGQLVPVGQEPEKEVIQRPVEVKEIQRLRGWNNLSF